MSYRIGTPHYNLPQTEGTDTRDWFDTNEAFALIDAAIFSAGQTAEAAKTDLTEVKTDIQGLKDADIAMTGRVDGIDTRVGTAELKIDRLQDEVIDDNQDLKDAICSIEEASATAAYPHNTGEFFWYNDTLYKASANIAIGQQIVPDTNCKTTNITTELLAGSGGGVEIDDSTVSVNKVWSSSKTNTELGTKAESADVYVKSEVYTKAEIDALLAEIGGGGMPLLDFDNPLHTFTADGTYTTSSECWLGGIVHGRAVATITIGDTVVYRYKGIGSSSFDADFSNEIPWTKVPAGTTITVSGFLYADCSIGVYAEA